MKLAPHVQFRIHNHKISLVSRSNVQILQQISSHKAPDKNWKFHVVFYRRTEGM